LVIPAGAPLITGRRAVVYVAVPGEPGKYRGREIVLGPRAGDHYLVRHGLEEGQEVVTHGNFKIDSAVQIRAKPSMMGGGADTDGGHAHHGHGAESGTGSEKASASLVQAPDGFRRQLRPVVDAYHRVSEAVEAQDLAGARKAFAKLWDAVEGVDGSKVSGRARRVWLELMMLLENDAVIGREARKLKDARRTFHTLTGHIQRLQARFDPEGVKTAERPFLELPEGSVPQAFQKQVNRLLDAYLVVQEALAADRFQEAKSGMQGLREAIRSMDMSLLEGRAREVWMDFFINLEQALAQLDRAEDPAALRQCFAPLSEAMALTVGTFGIHPREPVYKIRCPMAFENQGANWLQRDKEVRNPYFGAAMLRCGEVIRTFFGGAGNGAKEHDHG
jgi:Cu(I)/Ag(I) efflux system membrane fusion protein